MSHTLSRIPIWLKTIYTLFVCFAVVVNVTTYGPADLLWFSDIALILAAVAMWLENSLLASMMAVGIVLPEIGWTIVFLCRLLTGMRLGGAAGYMFNSAIPLGIRAVSLFHLFLPVLMLWMTYRLGYDRKALPAQTLLCWAVLIATFALTKRANNINWVFGPGAPQHLIPPLAYLPVMMLLLPLIVYLPSHWALKKIFGGVGDKHRP